ncbi:MAG TPA: adenylate/guanylate cyclase domain-containing protein [Bryobacteraceae bacterium]|nr:adenylate/guanylate cyclase domain-containing protein [Bryobacteraceae bacterium]
MTRNWKRVAICAAIALSATIVTLLLDDITFVQLVKLKAQDVHFILRGKQPTKDIVIITMDDRAEDHLPEPQLFWRPYYADAIQGVAAAGAKVLLLDTAFGIPVAPYASAAHVDDDSKLAGAYAAAFPTMPVVSAWVPSEADQKDPAFAIPINMMSSALGGAAMAALTVDPDDFVRKQVMMETPEPGVDISTLKRSMALHAAEKFLGIDATIANGRVFLGKREIPVDKELNMTINFAGPSDTFPKVSLYDVIQAGRSNNMAQMEKWFKGKAVLLGPDSKTDDRHSTPFYTAFGLSKKWQTAGVEIHANSLLTLLKGDFLRPVPDSGRIATMVAVAGGTVAIAATLAVAQTSIWSLVLLAGALVFTHVLFRFGWLMSSADMLFVYVLSLIGGIVFRFATAEKKSSFFKSAVALFVGKDVAKSLDQSEKIGLTGQRQMVTILFTDIRGFTAFCESKDPAVIVDLLNVYMALMCKIIVAHHGHVNKFIGDGILAVFADTDEGAVGNHAQRSIKCASEMVTAPNDFKTGAGMHSGEVVIGNVGSSDKMEFTVLGDTVNLASRLESLNKEHKTKLLLSGSTYEIAGGEIDTVYLGAVPVRGKTEPMKLFTLKSLMTEDIRHAHNMDEKDHVVESESVVA